MQFGVIFDMDGLMLDTERIARKVLARAMQDSGFALTDAVYLSIVGRTIKDAEKVLKDYYGLDFPFNDVYLKRQAYYEVELGENGVPVKPGLVELLDYLDRNAIPRAVASSTFRAFAQVKLSGAGIAHRFPTLICGDEVANGKPAPDLFLEAAALISLNPQDCIVLEDSEAGIRAAFLAGTVPVMIPDLKQPSPDVSILAWRILPSLHEVIPLLEEFRQVGLPAFGLRDRFSEA